MTLQIVDYEEKTDTRKIAELQCEVARLKKLVKRKTNQIMRLSRHLNKT